ncbi:MAG: redoxin domain-containing protein [Chitinophagaceae bacterium]
MCTFVSFLQAQTTKKINTVAAKTIAQPAFEGYSIHVTIKPYKNKKLYLGCYYGKYKNLVDSVFLDDKSEAVFKGKEKLPQGIYFLVSPERAIMFEIFMDEQQHFSIKADSVNYSNVIFTGSKENSLFQEYTSFISKQIPQITSLQQQLKTASAADSARINTDLKKLNKAIADYRDDIIKNHSKSMLALFFKAVKLPDLPDKNMNATQAAYYIKQHYWDGVSFTDPRLLRTPFFDSKLDEYFKYYISAEPDSISAEINYMLLSSRTNPELYKYLLGKFTDKYMNPEIMGQDKVFIFLFDNFYAKGDTTWLSAAQKKYIFDRAYSLIANQIGEPAPTLDLVDSSGKTISLYNVQAPFTVVLFWDPDCSHCKVEVPQLDSMYEAKWKAQGIKIFAVNVADAALKNWKNFVAEHHLEDWINVYQPAEQRRAEATSNQPNYRQLYDVFQTPTLYLLDSSKNIIAKKLSLEQFDDVIQAKIKNAHGTPKQ